MRESNYTEASYVSDLIPTDDSLKFTCYVQSWKSIHGARVKESWYLCEIILGSSFDVTVSSKIRSNLFLSVGCVLARKRNMHTVSLQ